MVEEHGAQLVGHHQEAVARGIAPCPLAVASLVGPLASLTVLVASLMGLVASLMCLVAPSIGLAVPLTGPVDARI